MYNFPKKIFLLICGLVMFSSSLLAEVKIGSEAPNFNLKDAAGKTLVSLGSYKGKKIVYLNFFATWCANCKEEMETLKELYSTYNSQGLELIAINVKERPDKVNKFISQYSLPFQVLLDENAAVAKEYDLVGFPANIIVDGEGIVRFMDSRPPSKFKELFDSLKPTIKSVDKSDEKNLKKK